MRYLAIDYGKRRIGLAVCDAEEILASPLKVLEKPDLAIQHIGRTIHELGIGAVVLGYPLNMNGSEGFQAKEVRAFAKQLQPHIEVPIHFQDERLSSFAAREKRPDLRGRPGKRGKPWDALAAAEILTAFLEAKHGN